MSVEHTCEAILEAAERVFAARTSWILLYDRSTKELVTCAVRGPGAAAYAGARISADSGLAGLAFRRREVLFVPDANQETRWYDSERVRHAGVGSAFTVPLAYQQEGVGILGIDSPRFTADSPPAENDIARLRAIAALAAVGLRNARLFEALDAERARLDRSTRKARQLRGAVAHLSAEVRQARAHAKIVGNSDALKNVLAQVAVVAPADSTVLIVGETGTGKELLARAIHDGSRRANRAFVAVNCAALPDTLIESELFGYEKGAFTGAVSRKPGKFELADEGTLFLDEIGDMPLAAQSKLLRAIQEREVQRVGGTSFVSVNVRLIAATNQRLDLAIQDGRFRSDLFYRISVFPIQLPPLCERRSDIPALIEHFANWSAARQHTSPPRFTPEALAALMSYTWPGNIRELQNVVERAVILAQGGDVGPDLLTFPSPPPPNAHPSPVAVFGTARVAPPADAVNERVLSFSDAEREAILKALQLSGWRVSGADGAARLLGLKPTTLHAKMKKLRIRRPSTRELIRSA